MVSKRLLIFCDGDAQPLVPQPSSASNVFRLSCSVKKLSENDRPKQQIVFYQSGYELGIASDGSGVTGSADVLGMKMANKIRDAYSFISHNFDTGDEIFLFGFSSGAYAVRKLIELIDDVGILEPSALGHFFRIWRNITAGDPIDRPPETKRTRIRCVGLWDTVGTVYESIDALALKRSVLPLSVDFAFHALSFQENRLNLAPVLLRAPESRWGSRQIFKEVWFPGSHGDVGGVYEKHELADISLFWMTGEIRGLNLFDLDADFIRESKQRQPGVWDALKPSGIVETNVNIKDRLSSGHMIKDAHFHVSCIPQKPRGDLQLLGHETLQNTLGRLTYAEINRFESDCITHWNEEYMGTPPSARINVSEVFLKGGSDVDSSDWTVAGTDLDISSFPGSISKMSLTHDKFPPTLQRRGESDNAKVPQAPKRWIRIEGVFTLDKLNGLVPVTTEKGAEVVYTTQAYLDGQIYEGTLQEGHNCLITCDGKNVSVEVYNVLVLNPLSCLFNHEIGQVEAPQGYYSRYPKTIEFSPEAASPTPPRVVLGLNHLAFRHSHSSSFARIRAYADEITTDRFMTHVDSPQDSKFGGGGVSWLRLSAADPDFRCGFHEQSERTSEPILVSFGWKFKNPPTVFVGLSGFDMKDRCRLSVFPTDISHTGFRLNIDKGLIDATLYACSVTWIAFPIDKGSVSHGTFGKGTSGSGRVSFTSTFKRSPMIFTALQSFDINPNTPHRTHLHVATDSVTTTEMGWRIEQQGGRGFDQVRVAYLALDPED